MEYQGREGPVAERVDHGPAERGFAGAGLPGEEQDTFAPPQPEEQIVEGPPVGRAPENESWVRRKREGLFAQAVERLVQRFIHFGCRCQGRHAPIICYKWLSVKWLSRLCNTVTM